MKYITLGLLLLTGLSIHAASSTNEDVFRIVESKVQLDEAKMKGDSDLIDVATINLDEAEFVAGATVSDLYYGTEAIPYTLKIGKGITRKKESFRGRMGLEISEEAKVFSTRSKVYVWVKSIVPAKFSGDISYTLNLLKKSSSGEWIVDQVKEDIANIDSVQSASDAYRVFEVFYIHNAGDYKIQVLKSGSVQLEKSLTVKK